MYKKRLIEKKILDYLEIFPVIAVTGSRQTGKSTLLKHLFTKEWQYYSLDDLSLVEMIRQDPNLFINNQIQNFIIDEAQKLPEIFEAIKLRVDQGHAPKIILSGSANFLLLTKVTESLAGRAGILNLYPYNYTEATNQSPSLFLDILLKIKNMTEFKHYFQESNQIDLIDCIFKGGYPKIYEFTEDQKRKIWLENYRSTYLERDLRDLGQIANLHEFQRYYEMLAYQTGNLLNLSNLAQDIGLSVNTCKKYLSILISSYQYFTLEPFCLNLKKRLIKTPKIFIWDTGLGCFLLRYRERQDLFNSGKYGNFVENWVITELLKQNSLLDPKFNFSFYRTVNGAEVDLILEYGETLIPIEIKSGDSLSKEHLRGIFGFIDSYKGIKQIPLGLVLYQGTHFLSLSETVLACPMSILFESAVNPSCMVGNEKR